MNARRRSLLPVLVIVLLAPVLVGPIGVVELSIWVGLIIVWALAFTFWAKDSSTSRGTVTGSS